MNLLTYTHNELGRNINLLPADIALWLQAAQNNVANFGIHQTQVAALKIMMDGLISKQKNLYGELDPTIGGEAFAEDYLTLNDEITGAFDLWRIFRQMFNQRKDETVGAAVDAADLIAADCYLFCMNRARNWGLIQENQFREPPLTYLEAQVSPVTANRGNAVETLGFPVRRYRDMRLPIPIVLQPYQNAFSIWTACLLHHEVGHNIDQDLNVSEELKFFVLSDLTAAIVPDARQRFWLNRTSEILADVFGIILGGSGFAFALCNWLLVLAPASRFNEILLKDPHPPLFIRIKLIIEMLKLFNVKLMQDAAAELENVWNSMTKPNEMNDYFADCQVIAKTFLDQKLDALGGRNIREFNPQIAADMTLADNVAACLPLNFACPDPKFNKFPHRLVPVAAQIALNKMPQPDEARLEKLQINALAYLNRIERPPFLDGNNRQEFLRNLTEKLDFRTQKNEEV